MKLYMPEDEICVRYRQAKNRFEKRYIMADLNLCSVDDIDNILEKNGFVVKRKSKYNTRGKMDPQKAMGLLRNGKSATEIADALGVSKKTVWAWMERTRA